MSYKRFLIIVGAVAWTIIAVRTVLVVRHTWQQVNTRVDAALP